MSKKCKLIILMILSILLGDINSATAQTCTIPPTCDELGYTKKAADCGSSPTLKCPFDQDKVFCHTSSSPSTPPNNTTCPVGVVKAIKPNFLVNRCSAKYIDIAPVSYFTCTATSTQPSSYSISVSYETEAICLQAYNNAMSSGIIGCCSSTGSVSAPLAPNGYIQGTNPIKVVGQTYINSSGIALGTIVAVDSTGQHGTVAVSAGTGTVSAANTICNSKTAGGLNWSLATGKNACYLLYNNSSLSCSIYSTTGSGKCYDKSNFSASSYCDKDQVYSFVCEAPF